MAAPKLKYSIGNAASTTLSSSITDSDTSAPLSSDTSFSAKSGEGIVLLDEGAATEEIAYSTGKSGASLTIPLANRGLEGGSAQAHSNSTTVKGVMTAGMWNDLVDTLLEIFDQTTGKFVQLKDANGNEILKHTATASAVNEITIKNAATANPPEVQATGSDTNIDLKLVPKGTGVLTVPAGTYEANVTDDDDIPNKKYVDDKVSNYPRGFLINGKIVPSVASNNLTVAIKTSSGDDPSASSPVSVRIGDTIRTITAALSVTKNAGTNWFNAGGTALATQEVDYFVYLGYNATDGVTVGFSRIIGSEYDDFSTTSTNEKYCAISTITNAAAGDDYELIGRFAATLSAGAGYTWTVPTFTNKNLIQRPIYETRWLDFTSTPTTSGTAYTNVPTIHQAKYLIRYNTAHIRLIWQYNATSGGTAGSLFTIPLIPAFNYQSGFGTNKSNPSSLTITLTDEATPKIVAYDYDGSTPIVNSHLLDGQILMQI